MLKRVKDEERKQFLEGVMACLPTIPGYWSIGFAAGAIGTLSGFTPLQTTLLAGALYAGSAQFLFYSLWAAGAEMASVILSVVLVNLRYLLMSSSMSVYFRNYTLVHKLMSGLLLTDETFGVAAQHGIQQGCINQNWMHGLNFAAWINWVFASLLGALLASVLPAGLMEGLSFSLVSMFIGLVLMLWFASRRKSLETINIMAALAVTLMFDQESDLSIVVIIAASLAATLSTLLLRTIHRGSN